MDLRTAAKKQKNSAGILLDCSANNMLYDNCVRS